MATKKRTSPNPATVDDLRKQVSLLKKKNRKLESERDALQTALHTWAKQNITAQDLHRWFESGEEEIEGSLMDCLRDLAPEKKAV